MFAYCSRDWWNQRSTGLKLSPSTVNFLSQKCLHWKAVQGSEHSAARILIRSKGLRKYSTQRRGQQRKTNRIQCTIYELSATNTSCLQMGFSALAPPILHIPGGHRPGAGSQWRWCTLGPQRWWLHPSCAGTGTPWGLTCRSCPCTQESWSPGAKQDHTTVTKSDPQLQNRSAGRLLTTEGSQIKQQHR